MQRYKWVLSVIIFFILSSNTAFGDPLHHSIIDVYGTDQLSVNEISNRYKKEFDIVTNSYFENNKQSDPASVKREKQSLTKIKNALKKMGDFSYINITPIIYSDKNDIYYTIDAVDKIDTNRLKGFIAKPHGSYPDPDKLIETWEEYEKTVFDNFPRNTIPKQFECPAFHCIEGVYLPQYNSIFANLVPKNKAKLITILRHDKDENMRGSAAYLLAYINDGNELINILVPSMRDSSSTVRNNVMRVLAFSLIEKLKNADFPIQKAIDALQYPTAYDRNKASAILFGLASQPRYAKYIKEHAKSQLITQLHMLQPNVHDMSFLILRTISGLKYGDRNYSAWENWLSTTIVSK